MTFLAKTIQYSPIFGRYCLKKSVYKTARFTSKIYMFLHGIKKILITYFFNDFFFDIF